MIRTMGILRLALAEALAPAVLPRTPEPSAEMRDRASIEGFHQEGTVSLLPVYHFNAAAIDALAPRGAHILDLGCGSGQFLAYLATCRPDLQITGIDLSVDMVAAGREMLMRRGLNERVRLFVGDMRDLRSSLPARVDLLSSVFSLHHLSTHDDLTACLREAAAVMAVRRAGLWIFDHARPRREDTARRFPEVFTPAASAAFKLDSCNSLKASWSFQELARALRTALGVAVTSSLARWLPMYQLHWLGRRPLNADRTLRDTTRLLPSSARRDARSLARLFRCQELPYARRHEGNYTSAKHGRAS
jgi:SAM-dependent methyltransferase